MSICETYDPELCESSFLANVGGSCWAESTIAALAYPDSVRPHMRALEAALKGTRVANILRAILNVYDATEAFSSRPQCPTVSPAILLYTEAVKFLGRRPAFGPGTGYNTFPAVRIVAELFETAGLSPKLVDFVSVKRDEPRSVARRLDSSSAQVVVLNFSASPAQVPTEVEGGWSLVACTLVVGGRMTRDHAATFLRCNNDPRMWILDSADASPVRGGHPRSILTFPLRVIDPFGGSDRPSVDVVYKGARATPMNGEECVLVYVRNVVRVLDSDACVERHTPESLLRHAIAHVAPHVAVQPSIRGGLKRVYETIVHAMGSERVQYWDAFPSDMRPHAALWAQGEHWFLCTRASDHDECAWVLASTAFPSSSCIVRLHADWNRSMNGVSPLLPLAKAWALKVRGEREVVSVRGHECLLFYGLAR